MNEPDEREDDDPGYCLGDEESTDKRFGDKDDSVRFTKDEEQEK